MTDEEQMKQRVAAKIEEIKGFMPETYKSIQARAAAGESDTFNLVRRGLRGEPNCFYALERGRVVGAPFNHPVMDEVAANMVQWGCSYVCIFPSNPKGTHGTH